MDKWAIRGFAIAAILFSFFFGYAIGFRNWPTRDAIGTLAEWASAGGTFLAAGVAIYIAFWSDSREGRGAKLEGALEAVAASTSLKGAAGLSRSHAISMGRVAKQIKDAFEGVGMLHDEEREFQDVAVSTLEAHHARNANETVRQKKHAALENKLFRLTDEWNSQAEAPLRRLHALLDGIPHAKLVAYDAELALAVVTAKARLVTAERYVSDSGLADLFVSDMSAMAEALEMACDLLPPAQDFLKQDLH